MSAPRLISKSAVAGDGGASRASAFVVNAKHIKINLTGLVGLRVSA